MDIVLQRDRVFHRQTPEHSSRKPLSWWVLSSGGATGTRGREAPSHHPMLDLPFLGWGEGETRQLLPPGIPPSSWTSSIWPAQGHCFRLPVHSMAPRAPQMMTGFILPITMRLSGGRQTFLSGGEREGRRKSILENYESLVPFPTPGPPQRQQIK